ncbi:putative transporter [Sedimentisphaera cyanobacteriorum]|uniref:Putative transporter n=1 Tax=Sedimentisphaera cyanobacteriorum TaxID=1940790 RepID=A0A1Q2HS24_9BACT|nr:hypothetical protein [Sedimentisphaera cyanobacteriorum]AQQ10259.1 putative transporter [Sedimentisphaera cyanobacteriorum]
MITLNWIVVLLFICGLTACAAYTRKYLRNVESFLAAERCGGRYMISVSNSMAGLGVISLMYLFQISYDTGFTSNWWFMVSGTFSPVAIFIALSGWVVYRFRQTRAMTLPEFLEMRYSRGFRVFAGIVAFVSGILNFGIFPSIGARFFMFFCDLPETFKLFGLPLEVQMFPFIMVIILGISVFFTFSGGQITVMFTDFIQGAFTTFVFALVVGCLFHTFSKTEIAETVLSASSGRSLVNPFDLAKEENFNIRFYLIAIFMNFYLLLAWQGTAGYNCCAKNPHEAKMAKVLEPWKLLGIIPVLTVFMPIGVRIYTQHENYADKAVEVNAALNEYVAEDLAKLAQDNDSRADDYLLLSTLNNAEAEQLTAIYKKSDQILEESDYAGVEPLQGRKPEEVSKLARLYHDKTDEVSSQMRLPLVIGNIIPVWLKGLFCAAMLAAFISTHNTYLHSWGSMFMQDVVLPFRKKPLSNKHHLRLLKLAMIGVAIYVFFFSLNFKHAQRIMLYCQITASIFFAGAGTVIIGGLYWKRGTNKAAWFAMAAGVIFSIIAIMITQSGVSAVDGAIEKPFWVSVTSGLEKIGCAEAFWEMARNIFALNSQEFLFIISCLCITIYVITSLVSKEPAHNMDKLLHRGKYAIKDDQIAQLNKEDSIASRLGLSKSFTKGDCAIAIVSIVWIVFWLIVFIAGSVMRKSITDTQWLDFWYVWMWVMYIVGIIVMIWLTIGGFKDLKVFIKTLKGLGQDEA